MAGLEPAATGLPGEGTDVFTTDLQIHVIDASTWNIDQGTGTCGPEGVNPRP